MITFEPFPKLARLSRECVITEKLDGTNAQVIIHQCPKVPDADGFYVDIPANPPGALVGHVDTGDFYIVAAASRTRLITPGKKTDNFGFAAWVYENAEELVKLGPGRHFGEWYGQGIQRGYGLDHRRFALFHGKREATPACCEVVPTIYEGEFSSVIVDGCMRLLKQAGSKAVSDFMNPEGVVIYHTAAKVAFKKTFDDRHKEAA